MIAIVSAQFTTGNIVIALCFSIILALVLEPLLLRLHETLVLSSKTVCFQKVLSRTISIKGTSWAERVAWRTIQRIQLASLRSQVKINLQDFGSSHQQTSRFQTISFKCSERFKIRCTNLNRQSSMLLENTYGSCVLLFKVVIKTSIHLPTQPVGLHSWSLCTFKNAIWKHV